MCRDGWRKSDKEVQEDWEHQAQAVVHGRGEGERQKVRWVRYEQWVRDLIWKALRRRKTGGGGGEEKERGGGGERQGEEDT